MDETYAHMCRDEHVQIGHNDSTQERCPVCRERDRAERLFDMLRDIKSYVGCHCTMRDCIRCDADKLVRQFESAGENNR